MSVIFFLYKKIKDDDLSSFVFLFVFFTLFCIEYQATLIISVFVHV